MDTDGLEAYADELFRAALRICGNWNDAEDLAQETLLAALKYDGAPADRRAWLHGVLRHKHYDLLRRKYKLPTVSIDLVPDMPETGAEPDRPDAQTIRRAVAFLAEKHREVIVRHYLYGERVQDVADRLGLPRGTVLSRLSGGREALRKGLEMMDAYEKQSYRPERLDVCCRGRPGLHDEPWSLVGGDLMKQNILIVAYETPLTVVEIARALGIPTAYVEEAVRSLADAELMARIGNRFFTDFQIRTPEQLERCLDVELALVGAHYDTLKRMADDYTDTLRATDFTPALEPSARRKLETKSGTKSGSRALARSVILPVSKSAPLAFCADMILSVSSMSVGMKRSAMLIIMLISWTGTLSFLSGPSRISSPSVRAMGLVV